MKIAVVADTYPPKKDGVITYLRSILPALKEEHSVTLIAPRFSEDKSALCEGIEVVLTRLIPIELANYNPAIPNIGLVRVIRRADIVFVNDLAPLGTAALFAAHMLNKPTVLFCHHDESVMLSKAFKLEARRFAPKERFGSFVDRIVSRYYSYADVISVATSRFYQKLRRLKVPEEKIVFAPFAVDTSRFSPSLDKSARDKYGIKREAKVVLYLGRMSHEKNVEAIIRAIPVVTSKISNVYFVFAGGGTRLEEYKALAKKLAPGANAIFTGWVEWEATPEIYAMSDIFVFPSLHETQAFVIMEAMASSLAVIAPREPPSEHSYYEEKKNCLFLDNPKDEKELAEKIILLLQNDELQERLGRNARRKMETYSWTQHIAKLTNGFMQARRTRRLKNSMEMRKIIVNKYSMFLALLIFLVWGAKRLY